jgi:hypothetical protein
MAKRIMRLKLKSSILPGTQDTEKPNKTKWPFYFLKKKDKELGEKCGNLEGYRYVECIKVHIWWICGKRWWEGTNPTSENQIVKNNQITGRWRRHSCCCIRSSPTIIDISSTVVKSKVKSFPARVHKDVFVSGFHNTFERCQRWTCWGDEGTNTNNISSNREKMLIAAGHRMLPPN